MNIGTLVWQDSQGNLRIGTITGKELDEKGWAWFAVNWHDDGCHYRAMDWTSKLRNDGIDRYNRTYRGDEITVVAVKHLEKSVVAHMLLHRPRLSSEQELPTC